MFGIGKKKVVAAIKKQPLICFGDTNSTEEQYTKEGEMFVAANYGLESESS